MQALTQLGKTLRKGLNPDQLAYFAALSVKKSDYSRFVNDPVGYAYQVIGGAYWKKQLELLEALKTQRKIMVRSANTCGKSYLGGRVITNWWYDTRNPSICLTTAPNEDSVNDIIWKEVRLGRKTPAGLSPKAPRLTDAPNHYAYGFTTRNMSAFQGKHDAAVLLLFDECTGIEYPFWEAAESMVNKATDRWVCFFNPIDTNSYAYQAEQTGTWHVIEMSALEHPNIAAELAGLEPPIPNAVRLAWVDNAFKTWARPLEAGEERKATDIEWHPGSGKLYRPSPVFEARVLGQWPKQSSSAIWSDALISACENTRYELPAKEKGIAPEIGCDVARFGDDKTCIAAVWGKSLVHMESYQGQDLHKTANRLKAICLELEGRCGVPAKKIPVKIDATGLGVGVVDMAGEKDNRFNFIPINSSQRAVREKKYHNKRSELWDTTVSLAESGLLEWSRLSAEQKHELKRQLKAPKYDWDSQGRKEVEPKEDTKKKLGISPDLADTLNLTCAVTLFRPETKKLDKPAQRHADFYSEYMDTSRASAWKTAHFNHPQN